MDEQQQAQAVQLAEQAKALKAAGLSNFMEEHVEFDDDESERAEFYHGLERLVEMYGRIGRLEAYKQVLELPSITPKTAESTAHLADQEMDILSQMGVRFVDVTKEGATTDE